LNPLKKLFQQTAIYGVATVLPRMLSFILVPLYTGVMATGLYGEVNIIFAWFAIFNVFLAYGMETAFFRFFNKADDENVVISTSLISILVTTLIFAVVALLFQAPLAHTLGIDIKYVWYVAMILSLDALVIIPFAWLRATERPTRYAVIKIGNVGINLGLNVFFLLVLPQITAENSGGWFGWMYRPNFEISYILISNLIASGLTLIVMLPLYFRGNYFS